MKESVEDQIVAAVVKRLKARREELGISLNRLAEAAGMTHVGILQIESGARSPLFRTALKLAAALDLKLSRILAECEE